MPWLCPELNPIPSSVPLCCSLLSALSLTLTPLALSDPGAAGGVGDTAAGNAQEGFLGSAAGITWESRGTQEAQRGALASRVWRGFSVLICCFLSLQVQIQNKKVDLSKVSSKCGSKANIKHKPGRNFTVSSFLCKFCPLNTVLDCD